MKTNNFVKTVRNFFFGFACLAATALTQAEEAYLGVSGYITNVPKCLIVETTTVSTFTNSPSSVNKGFKIKSVQSGSPARNAGLRTGDIIIEAEAIWINSYSSLAKMRKELARNDNMYLSYVRNGEVYSTTISGGATSTITSE